MNKDQVKGVIKDAAGQVQQKVGAAVGSDKQEIEGIKKQIEGKLQKSVGDVKENIKDVIACNRLFTTSAVDQVDRNTMEPATKCGLWRAPIRPHTISRRYP
jgi:uncharacterized protein YjbJ (UPF0337 family)